MHRQGLGCVGLTKHHWKAHYIMPWYEDIIRAMPGRQKSPPPRHQQSILGGVPFSSLHLITRGSEWPRASRWHSIRVSHLAVFVLPPWARRCSCCHLIIIPCWIPIKRWVCLLSSTPPATAPHLCYSSAWQEVRQCAVMEVLWRTLERETGLNLIRRFWSRKSSPLLLHCNMHASGSVFMHRPTLEIIVTHQMLAYTNQTSRYKQIFLLALGIKFPAVLWNFYYYYFLI